MSEYTPIAAIREMADKEVVPYVCGKITKIEEKTAKTNGSKYQSVVIQDNTGSITYSNFKPKGAAAGWRFLKDSDMGHEYCIKDAVVNVFNNTISLKYGSNWSVLDGDGKKPTKAAPAGNGGFKQKPGVVLNFEPLFRRIAAYMSIRYESEANQAAMVGTVFGGLKNYAEKIGVDNEADLLKLWTAPDEMEDGETVESETEPEPANANAGEPF